jgi:hypothetical protein
MMYKAFLIGASSLIIIQTASAQTPGQSTQGTPNQQGQNQSQTQSQQQNPTIAAKLRQNLQAAGFTDIQLMPSSFMVRAKDRDGNPVMMVINPDSVTAVTEIGSEHAGGQDNHSTTGQSGSGQKDQQPQK